MTRMRPDPRWGIITALLAGCQPAPVDLASRLAGSWLLASVCVPELPEPRACEAETGRVVAAFDTSRQTVEFTRGLPSGPYQLTTERAPSGMKVTYLLLSGGGAPAQLEIRADTLVTSWFYVEGAGYRFVRAGDG